VRTQPRARDPAQMKPAVINVHRPLTLAPRKPIVRMHFPEPWGGVRRARAGTKVWQPRVAREARHVASGANSHETRVESFSSGKVLSWCDEGVVWRISGLSKAGLPK